MEIARAREDLLVAASAGVTTVALAVASSAVATVTVGTIPALAPIAVYLVYLFSRKGGPYGPWDTPRNWALAAVGVGGIVLVLGAVGVA